MIYRQTGNRYIPIVLYVIFHFIIHTVKILRVYVDILPKPCVLYFLNENEKRVVFYNLFC